MNGIMEYMRMIGIVRGKKLSRLKPERDKNKTLLVIPRGLEPQHHGK